MVVSLDAVIAASYVAALQDDRVVIMPAAYPCCVCRRLSLDVMAEIADSVTNVKRDATTTANI
jgi:hypothetical protein